MTKKRKSRKRKLPTLHVTAPHGAKVKIHRKKSNPYAIQVGGQKRKYRIAVGRIEKWSDV